MAYHCKVVIVLALIIDTEYFNLSEKDARIANAKRKRPVPTIDQVIQVLEAMPSVTSIEMRDRALVAFILLTGARDSAVASLRLKHICIAEQSLYQDAREVNTKFSKTFMTYFFPVGELPIQIFTDWINHLTKELSFGPDDALFPKTNITNNRSHKFEPMGLFRDHWTTAGLYFSVSLNSVFLLYAYSSCCPPIRSFNGINNTRS